MSNQIENEKKFQLTLDKIEKDFGVGTIVGGSTARQKKDVISTGSLGLDIATGIGGYARGSVTELMGWESSGKSTLTLNAIANAQKLGLKALLVDAENSFDRKYAKALGVDNEKLMIMQLDEDGAEKCYDTAERLIKTGQMGIVVFDSQTALIPKKAMMGEAGDSAMGIQARLMSQMLPKIVTASGEHNCLTIYVSQYREKIGVMFGNPVTTGAGGNALKFYAHMRIEVKKVVQKEDEVAHHNKTTCTIVKNKMAPPFGKAEFDIIFGEGINSNKELVDIASELDVIKKSGSWYSYGTDRLGQGVEAVKTLFNDNPTLKEEIKTLVLKKVRESAE